MTVQVLYIVGMGRSGSTVIDRMLDRRADVMALGEMANTWRNGVVEDRNCACGERFSACSFWSAVSERHPHGLSAGAAAEVVRVHAHHLDSRRMWRVLAPTGRRRLAAQVPRSYIRTLGEVYEAVAATSGARMLVDSSKHPVYAYLLGRVPGIEVTLLHLVRDPRAVAYSWARRRIEPGTNPPSYMHRYPPLKAAALWDMTNMAARAVAIDGGRHEVIRYEDFVDDPAGVLLRLLPEEPGVEPGQRPAGSPTGHAMSGNPMRFARGPLAVRADDEWRHGQARRDRLVVRLATAPVALRYGYR